MNRALAPGGMACILFPNYDVPFEPHFNLPLVGSAKFTSKIFAKYIAKKERERNAAGLWKSLNFIKYTELRRYCREEGINIDFDTRIMALLLTRIADDTEFRKRHSGLLFPLSLALRLKLQRVVSLLPLRVQPYLMLLIRK